MSYEEFVNKEVKVRKSRPCMYCGEVIEKGDKGQYREYKFHGEFTRDHMHPECYKASGELYYWELDNGWSPGDYKRGSTESN